VKIHGEEMKEVDKFLYVGRVVEKNVKIQNEIDERTGMA
jgi:hypothetical protein